MKTRRGLRPQHPTPTPPPATLPATASELVNGPDAEQIRHCLGVARELTQAADTKAGHRDPEAAGQPDTGYIANVLCCGTG